MSTMEQVLRDEIAWHEETIASGRTFVSLPDHRARLAALTAALPAPGVEASGDWVMVPREATGAMCAAFHEGSADPIDWPAYRKAGGFPKAEYQWAFMGYRAMLAAAPSDRAEISQAQAQAMREAVLKEAAALADKEVKELKAFNFTQHSHGALIVKKAILAALPPEPPR